MSQVRVETECQKHEVQLHFYGGVSKKRCHECERDRQLDRIESLLDDLIASRPAQAIQQSVVDFREQAAKLRA